MATYSVYTALNDRWTNFATRKFRRLLHDDPELQLEIRTPDGRYTFPANLVAHHFPQGHDVDGAGRRIVVTINPAHQMKIHGVQERVDLSGFFMLLTEMKQWKRKRLHRSLLRSLMCLSRAVVRARANGIVTRSRKLRLIHR